MKKLILAIAALALIASPALAADWNMYGSARIATYYVTTDDVDSQFPVGGYGFGTNIKETGDDAGVQWQLQGNSRLGANVKAENLAGRVELALTASDAHDGSVGTRLIYGEWKFSDSGKLRVGKAYTPTSQFISGQVYAGDAGLLAIGTNYGRRVPGLQLMLGNFTIALLESGADTGSGGTAWDTYTDGDIDNYLPKLEAGWGMSLDTWSFNLMGGAQYVDIEDVVNNNGNTKDVDVTSWIIGGDVGFNFGPIYVKGGVSYGQNWTNARWSDLGTVSNAYAAGRFDGDDDVDDSDNFQGSLIAGFKFTDQLTFEAGYGYRYCDSDSDYVDANTGNTKSAKKDEAMNVYGQAVIAMAPGVWLIPEIGYFDWMDGVDGEDQGGEIYAGAKWQIDF